MGVQPIGVRTVRQLVVPRFVYESSLAPLVTQLGTFNSEQEIIVNWQESKALIPGAAVAVLAQCHAWVLQGRRVSFINHTTCEGFQYLQRMNFFSVCGISMPEKFRRQPSAGRFVEITRVGKNGVINTTELATKVAECISPEGANLFEPDETGLFDYIEYSISELTNNVVQHSRAHGFVFAQHFPSTDRVRIGIADCGIGIRQSFRDSGSPHYKDGMSDLDAINKALESRVSSKNHLSSAWGGDPVNAGVGLTLLREITRQVGGQFFLCSGEGLYQLDSQWQLRTGQGFLGTVCAMVMPRSAVTNFCRVLEQAKVQAGLLQLGITFSENFQ